MQKQNESNNKGILALKEEYEKEIEYVHTLVGRCSGNILELELKRAHTLERVIKDLEELLK